MTPSGPLRRKPKAAPEPAQAVETWRNDGGVFQQGREITLALPLTPGELRAIEAIKAAAGEDFLLSHNYADTVLVQPSDIRVDVLDDYDARVTLTNPILLLCEDTRREATLEDLHARMQAVCMAAFEEDGDLFMLNRDVSRGGQIVWLGEPLVTASEAAFEPIDLAG